MKKDYLIINREKWRYGGDVNDDILGFTQLLNTKGKMCCLGFRCHQLGIPLKALKGKATPGNLSNNWDIPDLIDKRGFNSVLTGAAISINDNAFISNEDREKRLIELFAKHDIIVKFKGKYWI